MKKILFIGLFLFFLSSISYSQCQLTTTNKTYKATCFESLLSGTQMPNSIPTPSTAEIAIAQNGNSGFFILKSAARELKNVYLFLDDGTTITLIDRDYEWRVNYNTYGRYRLTVEEINKLKQSNIRAIRYWTGFDINSSATEIYNKSKSYSSYDPLEMESKNHTHERVNFPKLIRNLFDN